jgi:hypothetical protein
MLLILFGWMIPHIRKIHLIVALLIGITWLIFLQSKGIGYCIITDWHWQVLNKLGKTDHSENYCTGNYPLLLVRFAHFVISAGFQEIFLQS